MNFVEGFSRLNTQQKLSWLSQFDKFHNAEEVLKHFWHQDPATQKLFFEFSENTVSNFYLPFGLVPNFVINGENFTIPMAIEESSVVAALSKAAKFWSRRGGFKASVISEKKVGQVHFLWKGETTILEGLFEKSLKRLKASVCELESNMRRRGGGLLGIYLEQNHEMLDSFQIHAEFHTCDAMGANFINTVLEALSQEWKIICDEEGLGEQMEVIMSILSNYNPECLVRASVDCPLDDLAQPEHDLSGEEYAQKFLKAIKVAETNTHRAVTHNKGIFNGIDGVVIATGNDFRAIEACGHAYAASGGKYQSLTHAKIKDGRFYFWIEIPLSLGTVGGLTKLHPLAKFSLELLNSPSSAELMQVVSSVGLAQNFSAINSLITTGIQKGHMKMHLLNILKHLEATSHEIELCKDYFQNKVTSFTHVREYLLHLRGDSVH